MRNTCLIGVAIFFNSSHFVPAAPIVTMKACPNIGSSGFTALDFYYSASPGGEFTNYRITIATDGDDIHDPSPADVYDESSDTIDTFANTVASFLGVQPPTHVYNSYHPVGFEKDTPPISLLDWTVFDTVTGDGNTIDGYPPAPYHLARVLVADGATGSATVLAFDSVTVTEDGTPIGTRFVFVQDLGHPPEPCVPEPTSLALVTFALLALGVHKRHRR